MTTEPDLVQIIEDMVTSLAAMDGMKGTPGWTLGSQLMWILDVRDLAREGQQAARILQPMDGAQMEVQQTVRIGMTHVEIRCEQLVFTRTDTSPEESQMFLDLLMKEVGEMVELMPQIALMTPADQDKKLRN